MPECTVGIFGERALSRFASFPARFSIKSDVGVPSAIPAES
jgi:hypothetical protein